MSIDLLVAMSTGRIIGYLWNTLFLYQLVATLTTVFILKTLLFFRTRHKRYQLFAYYGIPGPKPDLIEGNYGIFRRRPFKYEIDKHLREKYGKVFGVFLGDAPMIVVTDLEILKKVFIDDANMFRNRAGVYMSNTITENSLLFVEHKRWRILRKIMSPAFSSYAIKGDRSVAFINETIELLQNYVDQRLEPGESGKLVKDIDVLDLMRSTTLYMISVIAIRLPNIQICENDVYVKSLNNFLAQYDGYIMDWAISMPVISGVINFLAKHLEDTVLGVVKKRLHSAMDQYAREASNQSNANVNDNQMIDTLIRLEYEGKLSRNAVIGNALSILIAGYDTTSATLTSTLWAIAKHTEIQDKLRSEVIAHGVEAQYLDQVLNESLRLYPTVRNFTTRIAQESVQYGNLMIPKGAIVMYNHWLVQREPDTWPNPMKFDPERFRPGITHHPCAFAPFGLGEHRCLGNQLAILEIKAILCALLIRYKLRLKSPWILEQCRHADVLTKPTEKVIIEFERLVS